MNSSSPMCRQYVSGSAGSMENVQAVNVDNTNNSKAQLQNSMAQPGSYICATTEFDDTLGDSKLDSSYTHLDGSTTEQRY